MTDFLVLLLDVVVVLLPATVDLCSLGPSEKMGKVAIMVSGRERTGPVFLWYMCALQRRRI